MNQELLDRLRDADRTLYDIATERWADLQRGTFDLADFGKTRLSQAILQQELQDAIRKRGLIYRITSPRSATGYCGADIITQEEFGEENEKHIHARGNTEAEALCRAYLVAIEAMQG